MDDRAIFDALGLLALSKRGKPDERQLALYAQLLAPYPAQAVQAACLQLAHDADPFFPPAGAIVAAVAHWLRARGYGLPPDAAWREARRLIASYQPQSRPRPTSGNPAIDGAVSDCGGVQALGWDDAIGEGIARRSFLAAYERRAATPEHVAWALSPAATAPRTIPGIELPPAERAKLQAAGQDPDALALTAGRPDWQARYPQQQLPPGPPLTDDARAALRAELQAKIAQLATAWTLPPGARPDEDDSDTTADADDASDGRGLPVVDVSGPIAEARRASADRARARRERDERFG